MAYIQTTTKNQEATEYKEAFKVPRPKFHDNGDYNSINSQRLFRTCKLNSYLLANKSFISSSFAAPPITKKPFLGPRNIISFSIQDMSVSTSALLVEREVIPENTVQNIVLRCAEEDIHGGIAVDMKEPMDSIVFSSSLKDSIIKWKQQGKKGVWIKLPIALASLVPAAIEEGFRYHHAEPDYVMLVHWISDTENTLPANASHRVGVGAFVMNNKREVLVVQEKNGELKGKGVWKFPTGVVDEGEDICMAAIREVKEETGIDTEFVEVLAFRQGHKSFFSKSDLLFVCMLRPCSFDIQKQDSEIEAAQWMPVEDYAAQDFNQKHELFKYVANICLTKSDRDYAGFSPMATVTGSGKKSYLYFNNRDSKLY